MDFFFLNVANRIDHLMQYIADAFRALPPESPAVRRFRRSMQIDYWKWHDGIGYDIELLRHVTPSERRQIEALILERGGRDWRDVAALRTPRALEELRQALRRGDAAVPVRTGDVGYLQSR